MLGGGVGTRARTARTRRSTGWSWNPARRWWVVGAGLAVTAVVAGWVLWPDDEPPPRQREYRAETACLLTGDQGVAAPEAQPVWAGMQEASLATQVKVQYLEVDGPQTAQNAATFLAGLVQNRCDVVLTVGAAPVGAVPSTAARYPAARFVAFGRIDPGPNVSIVDASDPETMRRRAQEIVAALAPPRT